MKSLFRTIRRKLLEEGKLLRYLTYALGEIVLIVVGILLALKINDWNEDRKAQAEFDMFTLQLKTDLQLAISDVEAAALGSERAAKRDYKIVQYLEDRAFEGFDLKAFEDALIRLTRVSYIELRIGYLKRLLDGDFEILERNRSLALEALNLQTQLNQRTQILQRIIDRRKPYEEMVRSYYNLPITLIPESEIIYDLNRMKSSGDFKSAVLQLSSTKDDYHIHALVVKTILEDFLAALEKTQ